MGSSERLTPNDTWPDTKIDLHVDIASSADISEADWARVVSEYSELATEIIKTEAEIRWRQQESSNSSFIPYIEDRLQNLYDILNALYVPQQNPYYEPGSATVNDIQPGTSLLSVTYYGGEPNARTYAQITALKVGSVMGFERDGSVVSFTSEPGSVVTHYDQETPYQSPEYDTPSHYPSEMGIMPKENGYWSQWNITIIDDIENRLTLLDWLRARQEAPHALEAASILEDLIFTDSA